MVRSTDFFKFKYNEKPVYIILDHPVIIKCLKDAISNKDIKLNSLLFHIDEHLDLMKIPENYEKSKKILKMNISELDNFIKEDLHSDNSEFITNLFFSGIISSCISIVHPDQKRSGNNKYIPCQKMQAAKYEITGNKDVTYYNHVYITEDLEMIIASSCGLLSKQNIDYSDVKELFETKELILDIDLDYFTYSHEKTYPKNPRDIKRQITSSSFNILLDKSKVVIIALEPRCCGDFEGSFEILDSFNDNIFHYKDLKFEVMKKLL